MRASRTALAIAIAITGTASLSACRPSPAAPAAPAAPELPPAKSATMLVGEHVLDSPAIVDTEHARRVQAIGIVRSFQAEGGPMPEPGDVSHEQVLVKLDVAAGAAASKPFRCSDVDVVPRGTGDTLLGQQTTALLRDSMTAAGYSPLEDVAPGDVRIGWCSFLITVRPGSALELVLPGVPLQERPAARPEVQSFSAPLTAAR